MTKQIYLTFTIDTEPDSSGDSWKYRTPLSFRAVEEGIGKVLTPLFEKYGARPTYLINNVVMNHEKSVAVLRSLKNCELGAHLHPEFIEPECWHNDPGGHDGKCNLCFLKPETEAAKIHSITRLFHETFGYAPRSFRAGRWSARGNTTKILSELGYTADTSVTAGIRGMDSTRILPVDYRFAPRQPYHPSTNNICRKGKLSVWEIPVTVCGYFPFRRRWLRPAEYCTPDLVAVAKKFICQNFYREHIFLNCMFHDIDFMPDLGPHCKDEAKQKFFLSELERLLKFAQETGIKMKTLSETAEICGDTK